MQNYDSRPFYGCANRICRVAVAEGDDGLRWCSECHRAYCNACADKQDGMIGDGSDSENDWVCEKCAHQRIRETTENK